MLRPPRSTRTDTLFPYTTLFRSSAGRGVWVSGLRNGVSAAMLNDARIRAAKPGPKPTSLRMHTVLSLCVVQDLKPCRMKPELSTIASCGSSTRHALLRQPAPARRDQSHTGGDRQSVV